MKMETKSVAFTVVIKLRPLTVTFILKTARCTLCYVRFNPDQRGTAKLIVLKRSFIRLLIAKTNAT